MALSGALLEAITHSFRGWEPTPVARSPPPCCIFSDAALDPKYPRHKRFLIGLSSDKGPKFCRAPVWVDTQQSAELYGALVAIDEFRFHSSPHIQLVLDNMAAISQPVWGRAHSHLHSQHRILRRLAHKLRWTGALVDLYYADSKLNPADPVSTPFSFAFGADLVIQAHARCSLYNRLGQHMCWGQITDRDRSVH